MGEGRMEDGASGEESGGGEVEVERWRERLKAGVCWCVGECVRCERELARDEAMSGEKDGRSERTGRAGRAGRRRIAARTRSNAAGWVSGAPSLDAGEAVQQRGSPNGITCSGGQGQRKVCLMGARLALCSRG